MEIYSAKNDKRVLNRLSVFIQNYYNKLALQNSSLINNYYINLIKILYLIDNTKKYNLDKKNLIFSID